MTDKKEMDNLGKALRRFLGRDPRMLCSPGLRVTRRMVVTDSVIRLPWFFFSENVSPPQSHPLLSREILNAQ